MDFQSKFTLEGPENYKDVQPVGGLGYRSKGEVPTAVQFKDGGETIAQIKWIGGSTYGEFCPDQDRYTAAQNNNNEWYTMLDDKYTEYKDSYDSFIAEVNRLENRMENENDYFVSETEENNLKNLMNIVNQRSTSATNGAKISYNGQVAKVTQTDEHSAVATLTLSRDHLMFLPDFEISISADWLKFVYLVGKPEITKMSYSACTEESAGNRVKVTVVNKGTVKSKVLTDISCESGIGISASERSITLNPGESGTIDIPFVLSTVADSKKSCTVTVMDANNIAVSDSAEVSMDCVATKFCSPEGITRCTGDLQQICENGLWIDTDSEDCTVTEDCNHDSVCQFWSGESFENCGGKFASKNDCATCNSDGVCDSTETIYSCAGDCGNVPPKDYTIYWIIGAVIAAIGIYYAFASKSKNPKKRKRGRKR